MSNISAFPSGGAVTPSPGMSLRDYFAAKVLNGLTANTDYTSHSYEQLASFAYRAADAMLKERAK